MQGDAQVPSTTGVGREPGPWPGCRTSLADRDPHQLRQAVDVGPHRGREPPLAAEQDAKPDPLGLLEDELRHAIVLDMDALVAPPDDPDVPVLDGRGEEPQDALGEGPHGRRSVRRVAGQAGVWRCRRRVGPGCAAGPGDRTEQEQ